MSAEYDVTLVPARGDGRITEQDVAYALDDLPRDGEVCVHVVEADDFAPAAPSRLARELSGCLVRHVFADSARRVGAQWMEAFHRASAEYLAVEASRLHRGA